MAQRIMDMVVQIRKSLTIMERGLNGLRTVDPNNMSREELIDALSNVLRTSQWFVGEVRKLLEFIS